MDIGLLSASRVEPSGIGAKLVFSTSARVLIERHVKLQLPNNSLSGRVNDERVCQGLLVNKLRFVN